MLEAPLISYPLGLFDCCGVSDGAACAIVTTPDIARGLGKRDLVTVKALQLATSNGVEMSHQSWDGSYTLTTRLAAKRAYEEGGITNPREQIDLTEVHDCFSITELVLMEDLGFSAAGQAPRDIRDGRYDRDGAIPCQIDGGLKCFGHPIGATGLRMTYEIYLQLLGRAGQRQFASPSTRSCAQPRRNSQPQRGQCCHLRTGPMRTRQQLQGGFDRWLTHRIAAPAMNLRASPGARPMMSWPRVRSHSATACWRGRLSWFPAEEAVLAAQSPMSARGWAPT